MLQPVGLIPKWKNEEPNGLKGMDIARLLGHPEKLELKTRGAPDT